MVFYICKPLKVFIILFIGNISDLSKLVLQVTGTIKCLDSHATPYSLKYMHIIYVMQYSSGRGTASMAALYSTSPETGAIWL